MWPGININNYFKRYVLVNFLKLTESDGPPHLFSQFHFFAIVCWTCLLSSSTNSFNDIVLKASECLEKKSSYQADQNVHFMHILISKKKKKNKVGAAWKESVTPDVFYSSSFVSGSHRSRYVKKKNVFKVERNWVIQKCKWSVCTAVSVPSKFHSDSRQGSRSSSSSRPLSALSVLFDLNHHENSEVGHYS